MKICKIEECSKAHDSHGYCSSHARQFRRWGRIRTKQEVAIEISARNTGNTYNKGKKWSEEARKTHAKLLEGRTLNTGRTHFKKGRKTWNKGITGMMSAWNKDIKTGHTPWNKGLWGYNAGEKNGNWKGGVHTENNRIRRTKEYAKWRNDVFERDDFTCQFCKKRGVYIEADHIKPFAFFPQLRFLTDNGRTLCKECHMKTPTYKKHKFEGAV